MEPVGSMLHSQGLSNNPYPEPNQTQSLVLIPISAVILFSHLCLGLPKDLFPVGLPGRILKALLPPFIMATWPAHLNLLDLITLTIFGEWCVMFLNKDGFYSIWLLASCQTSKLEERSWLIVHDCLFNIVTANLHIWRPTPPSAIWGDVPCLGERNPRMEFVCISNAKGKLG